MKPASLRTLLPQQLVNQVEVEIVRRSRVATMIALVLVGGVLVGCSSSPETTTSVPSSSEAPRVGPSAFDIYLGDRVDLIDYAARKEEADCMARAGYPQLRDTGIMRFESEATKLVLDVQRALGYASEEDARSRGFGRSEGPKPAPVVSFDPNFDRAFEECRAEVAEILDTGERGLVDEYKSLGGLLNLEFGLMWARERFATDLAQLADCMVASGHSIRDREAFIQNDMATAFGISLGSLEDVEEAHWEPNRVPGTVAVGPALPARQYVPSPAEADLAVAWYRCDQQSGRVEKFLADGREQAALIVAKYEDRFAELNPLIEELAAKAATLV